MERSTRSLVALVALTAAILLTMSGGCGASKNNGFAGGNESSGSDAEAPGQDDGGFMGFGTSSGLGAGGAFTQGANNCPTGAPLSCYVDTNCPGGKHTTITGKVYDPAGKNPIYNVVVFVPTDASALPAITPGTNTCNTCSTPVGDHIAVTQTAEDGTFTLTDVPSGKNVPIVLQIGKWRRIVTVENVPDCGTAKVPDSGTGQARLPRNHMEGDLPQMALLTGGLDDLGCFMTRMGIDASEYSAPHGGRQARRLPGARNGGVRGPAAVPGSRTGRPATARTPVARSGRARRASSRTTSCSSPARATRSTRTLSRTEGPTSAGRRRPTSRPRASKRCTTG